MTLNMPARLMSASQTRQLPQKPSVPLRFSALFDPRPLLLAVQRKEAWAREQCIRHQAAEEAVKGVREQNKAQNLAQEAKAFGRHKSGLQIRLDREVDSTYVLFPYTYIRTGWDILREALRAPNLETVFKNSSSIQAVTDLFLGLHQAGIIRHIDKRIMLTPVASPLLNFDTKKVLKRPLAK